MAIKGEQFFKKTKEEIEFKVQLIKLNSPYFEMKRQALEKITSIGRILIITHKQSQ